MRLNFAKPGVMVLIGWMTIASIPAGVSGAFVAVKDYDENAVQANTVEQNAAGGSGVGSQVGYAQFKTNVANAFDAGLGGVINFDNHPTWAVNTGQPSFDVTFASGTKTMNVSQIGATQFSLNSASTSATPISGNVWGGFGGAVNPTVSFTMNGNPAPIVEWGITMISRNANRDYTISVTLDNAQTFAFGLETVALPIASDDTFFGYRAPAGRTIASVKIVHSGTLAFDDMGFILVPEPNAMLLLGVGMIGWHRLKRRQYKH